MLRPGKRGRDPGPESGKPPAHGLGVSAEPVPGPVQSWHHWRSPWPNPTKTAPTVAESEPLDLLVLGSGVAGLSAAVRAAETHGWRVGVLTKGELHQSATRWAQGGVAAVLGSDPDSTDLHLADTLRAGAGLCDRTAVSVLVNEGPRRVNELIALGAMFDRDADGELQLAREGGHSLPRVVHAGGAATGFEIERALVDAVNATAAAIYEQWFAVDLMVEHGRCVGVRAESGDDETVEVRSRNVLLATGGAGQMFAVTTNPEVATGDGIAMALRSGVAVADLEFVQFHPTALHHPEMPRPLLSEALRGHGALIRGNDGERFIDELLPRDEVSRAMAQHMGDHGVEQCWLDATGLESFAERFPTIAADLDRVGLDPATDLLPIAPAAHYLCGGVVTDLDGATTMPGLWGAGETTCNGIHGANRLASNSLLDGMVFAFRVVEAIERGKNAADASGAMAAVLRPDETAEVGGQIYGDWRLSKPTGRTGDAGGDAPDQLAHASSDQDLRVRLQQAMTKGSGVLRTAASLSGAGREISDVASSIAHGAPPTEGSRGRRELENLIEVATGVVAAAVRREESRGAHTRLDHPDRDDEHYRSRIILM
jgi:L-aspartate oxidase